MSDVRLIQEIQASAIGDAATFRREVAEAGKPTIIRGLCADWPARIAAVESWNRLARYLMQFETGATAQAFIGSRAIAGKYYYEDDLEGFNFRREALTLSETLTRIADARDNAEAPSVYMGSLPAQVFLPGFAEENRVALLDPAIEPRLWIGNASSVACHFDTFDNLACVIAGPRQFILYPPDAIADLYVGPLDHTMAGQPVSLAAGCAPGDPRYPRFEAIRQRAVVATLASGDALYLPKLWWHQVEARDPVNLMVNFWWDGFAAGPDAPFNAMMLTMIAISERPKAERKAWRAFFDHYVFRPDRHPLAHLPVERHGILGPLREGNYGRIRAMIMQFLRNT